MKRDGVFSQKTKIIKRIPFIPPPHPLNLKKTNKKKISLFERKVKKKRTLCIICLSSSRKRKKTPRR